MAKKYQQRTHVSIRKKKEEEAKLAKRRAFYLKNKQTILIAIGALAVIILLGSLVLDYFYAPGGSMKVFMGNLIGKTEDALIVDFDANDRGRYFNMGEMKTPEGYDRGPYEMYQEGDPNEQRFQFTAQDAARPCQSVYVTGVANKTGEEMLTTLRSYGLYEAAEEDVVTEIAGHKVRYMYSIGNPSSEENTDVYSVMLILYVDVLDGSTVAFNFNSAHCAQADLPTEEAMLQDVEAFLACYTKP